MKITQSGVKEFMQICHIRMEIAILYMIPGSEEHRALADLATAGTEYNLEGIAANPALRVSGRSAPAGVPRAQGDANKARAGYYRDAGVCRPSASELPR